jgi:hypothetical protein
MRIRLAQDRVHEIRVKQRVALDILKRFLNGGSVHAQDNTTKVRHI